MNVMRNITFMGVCALVESRVDFHISKVTLQWPYNEREGVSNHRRLHCLLNCLMRHRSKKMLKLRVTGLCEGDLQVAGEFSEQKASNEEKDSIWWRHHVLRQTITSLGAVAIYICPPETHLKHKFPEIPLVCDIYFRFWFSISEINYWKTFRPIPPCLLEGSLVYNSFQFLIFILTQWTTCDLRNFDLIVFPLKSSCLWNVVFIWWKKRNVLLGILWNDM